MLSLRVALAVIGLAVLSPDRAFARDASVPNVEQEASDPKTAQIRELMDGTLDVDVDPQSLFDVLLNDEAAMRIEAQRIRTLLAAVSVQAATTAAELTGSTETAQTAATFDTMPAESAAWTARLELDRARLSFYSLDVGRRTQVLSTHSARQQAEAERRKEEAALGSDPEREQALAAARAARAEAERWIAEELTRLNALEERATTLRRRLATARTDLTVRKDLVLGWQRRVREAKGSDAVTADNTYDALHRQLRNSRDELAAALAVLDEPSEIPEIGPDGSVEIPVDISTEGVRTRRAAVEKVISEAHGDEVSAREERCATLLEEITALNRERLGLLPHLTPAKRRALTGLTGAGWEQAMAEAKHLSLILRYHQYVARGWVRTLRSGDTGNVSPWAAAAFLVPLVGVLLMFFWGRRKSRSLLLMVDERMAAADRSRHLTAQSPARQFIRVLLQVHRPLEWMVLLAVLLEIVPQTARELVEVQLFSSVAMWSLMGVVVVNTVNSLAARREDALHGPGDGGEANLRLRSLRFVGGTVVVFGLTLILSSRLVGEGTIFRWVSKAAWFAVIPVFLVLVRWWRGTVFQRLDRLRKKTPLQAWILANRSGWVSFLAAMVGALLLFSAGTLRFARTWLSEVDVARRVHAYLFKREIERLGEGLQQLSPLPDETLDILHPERPFSRWIACPASPVYEAVLRRCLTRAGGVVAVHGARGMGKTSLLRALRERANEGAVLLNCKHDTSIEELQRLVTRVPESAECRMVLLDEVQTLIEARIGGLARFDELLAWMRGYGRGVTWVVALDAALWPLLQRARDSRPLFDECHELLPWQETHIGELLSERCEQAGIVPTYTDLLDKLPPGADEIERQEALEAKRAGYQRMLWDHVGGNPGLALEAWRASLARDASGEVRVRSLQTPDIATLEALPDASLFVLRAVLQLAPAEPDAVAQATRLRPEEVLVDFRYGTTRGYFEEVNGRVRIAWPWLGAVTRLLERRRLLVVS